MGYLLVYLHEKLHLVEEREGNYCPFASVTVQNEVFFVRYCNVACWSSTHPHLFKTWLCGLVFCLCSKSNERLGLCLDALPLKMSLAFSVFSI